MTARRSAWLPLACALAFGPVEAARAQAPPRLSEAARVYDHAATLYKNGQYDQAAAMFARADELATNDVALTQALNACLLADDAALGMGLAERAARAATDTPLARAAAKATKAFERRVGRVVVRCPEPGACMLDVDGVPLDAARRGFVPTGEHVLALHVHQRVEQRTSTIAAGATLEVAPEAEAPRPPGAPPATPQPPGTPTPGTPTPGTPTPGTPTPGTSTPGTSTPGTSHQGALPAPGTPARSPLAEPPPKERPSTWPFWTSLAITGALGIAGAVSLADLVSKHDAFASHRDDAGASSGRAAQTRTDVLFAAAGVGAVASAVLGILLLPERRPTTPGVVALF